ncbi:MAG: hypothetical protein WD048_16305 [Chitinophagales bacterium]
MNHKKNKKPQLDLSKLRKEDFDGHTDFLKLTPEQRLDWLAAAVQFYYKHGNKPFDKKKA